MRIYTSHWREGRDPRLLREGFSWSAFLFGFAFFTVCGAWIAAAISLAVTVLLARACEALGSGAPMLGLCILQGVLAQDIRRWSLQHAGWQTGPVVAAGSQDEALARLLGARPDLTASLAARAGLA